MENKRRKLKKKVKLYVHLTFFLLVLILLSLYLFKWSIDNYNTKKIIDRIYSVSDVNNKKPKKDYTNEETSETEEIDLKDINFIELLKINSDTVAWIKVNGTNINYPVVQKDDNKYYLTHSFNKKNNSAGWIFLDYRNNFNILNKNTIIYGHSRLDKTMFGSLHNLSNKNFFDTKENNYITLVLKNKITIWQIFSIYKTTPEDNYCKVYFDTDDQFEDYINTAKQKSYYNFNVNVSKTDYILTLSTCASNNTRFVVNAKLLNN